ncbi:Zn-dependent hydrolase [Paraburkholderia fungorum]|uniref:Zn-dependent hydrolase n=1 Tax=Paraburkholderia fungorum TaxID=134537 RepID=UPI00209203C4|nr:Zn-dependent hydrolase [Paraburkholderia fungorum]USU19375.1 Zn-dependent hydrolase [Paraburkholderia fungorum]USU28629.1 Zn-dependent hydrolase [Paraburkholderia fungorum]
MLKINGERLWTSLMNMAAVGATPAGGVRRLALTEQDAAGRALFSQWCVEAGLTLSVDQVGNLFARRAGKRNDAAPVASGSHLDTQPEGGRFDGVYGVLAALEVVRTLNDADIQTEKPIEIVVWTNEEGARFTPAMLGSAAFTAVMPLAQALNTRDASGTSVEQALQTTGYAGTRAVPGIVFDAYFEAHIEQGPVLEESGVPIGVVTGGQAIRWLDVHVRGQAAHAGTTPMQYRRDALFASAEMAAELERIAAEFFPLGLATIGELHIRNASRNTIAADLTFTVDLRHPDDALIGDMETALRERFDAIAKRRRLTVEIGQHWVSPATPFDPQCIAAVSNAVEALDYPHQRIISGAGHDAIHLAKHCPTAMIFIPCVDGLSHNEAEDALPEDVRRGTDVLLHAMLTRAGQAA